MDVYIYTKRGHGSQLMDPLELHMFSICSCGWIFGILPYQGQYVYLDTCRVVAWF